MQNNPSDQVDIIKLGIQDVNALKKISEQTFIDTYEVYNTRENMEAHLKETYNLAQLTLEINNKNCEYYFATIEGNITGYLKLNLGEVQTEIQDQVSIEIERIYVLKAYQGNRIGQQFIDFTIERAKEKRLKYVWLGVWEQNPRAIEFYHKMGFQEFDKHTFKLGDEMQTDFLMKIEL